VGRAWIVLSIALASGGACRRPAPAAVEPVRFYVAPGLPGAVAAEMARGYAIADPSLVSSPEEAEVAWFRSPTAALALGERAVPGSAPERPRTPGSFADEERRYAPVGGIATVIIGSARRAAPFVPTNLSQLADPRLRGAVALVPLGRGAGPRLVAALELAYGERGTEGWLRQLAANAPILVDDPRQVVAAVESGRAAFGLVDSLTACAASCEGLELVFPDQRGGGTVVTPTALVVLPGAGGAARKLAAWLAGPDAEDVLVQRAPGLLPLREGASAPDGVVPTWKLTHLSLDWSAVAARERSWRARLAGWPPRQGAGR